jgi:hypothetical protein
MVGVGAQAEEEDAGAIGDAHGGFGGEQRAFDFAGEAKFFWRGAFRIEQSRMKAAGDVNPRDGAGGWLYAGPEQGLGPDPSMILNKMAFRFSGSCAGRSGVLSTQRMTLTIEHCPQISGTFPDRWPAASNATARS